MKKQSLSPENAEFQNMIGGEPQLKVAKKRSSDSDSPTPSRTQKSAPTLSSEVIAQQAIAVAIGQRALDPVAIDLRGLTSVADFFVVLSGTSQRHLHGISDKIEAALKEQGERPISINGYQEGDWIILDYGDVVVHLLHEPARQFYNLDGLWREAPRLSLDPELEQEARRLRTGSVR